MAGMLLKLHPELYRFWISFERWTSRLRAKKSGILGEQPHFREAALELSRRGFDAVVFGHTHHPGISKLETGSTYFNAGSWMLSPHFVKIENGTVELIAWNEPKKNIRSLNQK